MRNDVELTRKIVEVVQEYHANPYIEQIKRLKLMNDNEFDRGYDEAIDDVIALLKGER